MAIVIIEPLKGGKLANPPAEVLEVIEKSKTKRTSVDWALQFLWNLPEVNIPQNCAIINNVTLGRSNVR